MWKKGIKEGEREWRRRRETVGKESKEGGEKPCKTKEKRKKRGNCMTDLHDKVSKERNFVLKRRPI